MRSDHDDTAGLGVLQQVPELATAVRVHAGSRLVQEDDLGVADEGHANTELAFLSTRKGHGALLCRLNEVALAQNALHLGIKLVLWNAWQWGPKKKKVESKIKKIQKDVTLETRENNEVLLDRELVKEDILLRAHTHDTAEIIHAGRRVVAKGSHRARGLRKQATEDRNQGRFAGTVVAEEAKDLALEHLQRHAIQSDLFLGSGEVVRLGEDFADVPAANNHQVRLIYLLLARQAYRMSTASCWCSSAGTFSTSSFCVVSMREAMSIFSMACFLADQ